MNSGSKPYKRRKSLLKYGKPIPRMDQEYILKRFWKSVERGKTSRLILLIHTSKIDISDKTSNPKEMRYNWNVIKSRYFGRFRICFVCDEKARCNHHIIAIGNGGNNDRDNIVPLCNECHSLIHDWM